MILLNSVMTHFPLLEFYKPIVLWAKKILWDDQERTLLNKALCGIFLLLFYTLRLNEWIKKIWITTDHYAEMCRAQSAYKTIIAHLFKINSFRYVLNEKRTTRKKLCQMSKRH
jgi:hypothetical protein